jgi:hypothetical protein
MAPLKLGDTFEGQVYRVLSPVKFVVTGYSDRATVPKPWKVVRILGLKPPDPRNPVWKEGTDFMRSYFFGQRKEPSVGEERPTSIYEYEVKGFDRNGTVVIRMSGFHSEPRVDFQYNTWTESISPEIVKRGFATLNPEEPTDERDLAGAESEAKEKHLGIWAH